MTWNNVQPPCNTCVHCAQSSQDHRNHQCSTILFIYYLFIIYLLFSYFFICLFIYLLFLFIYLLFILFFMSVCVGDSSSTSLSSSHTIHYEYPFSSNHETSLEAAECVAGFCQVLPANKATVISNHASVAAQTSTECIRGNTFIAPISVECQLAPALQISAELKEQLKAHISSFTPHQVRILNTTI